MNGITRFDRMKLNLQTVFGLALACVAAMGLAGSPALACPGSKNCTKKHSCSGEASDETKSCGGNAKSDGTTADDGHKHKPNHREGKNNPPVGVTGDIQAKVEAQTLTVKIAAPEGSHLNFDGPWKLELAKEAPVSGATDGKKIFGTDAFNKDLGQFEVKLNKSLNAGEKVGYKMTYFLCADDKTWCKRLQHEGQVGN